MSTPVQASVGNIVARHGSAEFLKPLRTIWSWLQKVQIRHTKKRLKVCETAPLGDKRFVAVIRVDDREFLIAGASNSVSMLTELNKQSSFSAVLAQQSAQVNG